MIVSILRKEVIEHREYQGAEFIHCFELKEGVKRIEDFAFHRCIDLIKVKLPNSLEHIGRFAFRDCPLLDSIILPDNITYIGEYAFSSLTNKDLTLYIHENSPLHLLLEVKSESLPGLVDDNVRIKIIKKSEETDEYT